MYEDVQYVTEDGIATVTIDRPEVFNSFTERTVAELNDALRRAGEDDNVYVVVLTGAGDGFCAGADVTSMPEWSERSFEEYAAFLRGVQNVVRQLRTMHKPTIAAVGGPAIGAGCDFALAADLRYVGEDALLRQGFVQVGLVPGDGGAWLLPRLVGWSTAMEYLLTGKDITPEAAKEMGLAMGVSEDPLEDAQTVAEAVRDLPAEAVWRTKSLADPSLSFEEYCRRAIEHQWACVNDPEHEEAVQAFREDRDPEFDR